MKKKNLKKLSLTSRTISNFHSLTITGGETCESPCQGGTSCCDPSGSNDNDPPEGRSRYNCLLYYLYSKRLHCFD